MIHGQGIGNAKAYTISYPGVKLEKVSKVENRNYVFLNIDITLTAKPATLKIKIKDRDSSFIINFPIKKRSP